MREIKVSPEKRKIHNKPLSPRFFLSQFNETWSKLSEWLEESEKALDSELEIANEPDKIKAQLAQHKVLSPHSPFSSRQRPEGKIEH